MYQRQYGGDKHVSFVEIVNLIVQTIIYFIQEGIMNSNQTLVGSNCLEIQQTYISWINFSDILLLIGMITSAIFIVAMCIGGAILELSFLMKLTNFGVSLFSYLFLFFSSQFMIFN